MISRRLTISLQGKSLLASSRTIGPSGFIDSVFQPHVIRKDAYVKAEFTEHLLHIVDVWLCSKGDQNRSRRGHEVTLRTSPGGDYDVASRYGAHSPMSYLCMPGEKAVSRSPGFPHTTHYPDNACHRSRISHKIRSGHNTYTIVTHSRQWCRLQWPNRLDQPRTCFPIFV